MVDTRWEPRSLAWRTVPNVKANRSWPDVGDNVWNRIRDEFGLLTEDQFEAHVETLYGDAEPFLQRAVRVFIGDDTFFPGFQFVGGMPSPVVTDLFAQAMGLQIPHNVFAAWMVTPVRPRSQRPVDALDQPQILTDILDAFGHGRAWVAPWDPGQPSAKRPGPGSS